MAISGDGRVVVGTSFGPPDHVSRTFLWSKETGILPLAESARPISVSADGKTVIGIMNGSKGSRIPVRWTVDGRKVTQSVLSPDHFPSQKDMRFNRATSFFPASADLSVLGWNSFFPNQAWLATDNRLSKLGPYEDNPGSSIHAISLNGLFSTGVTGTIAADWWDIPVFGQTFVASRLGTVFTIPPLPGDLYSFPAGLSADASVLISANSDIDPFVWSPESGKQRLKVLLSENGIYLPFSGPVLPVAVSAEGSTILCVLYVFGRYEPQFRSFLISGFPARENFEFESPNLKIRGSKNIETSASAETLRGVATDPHLTRLEYRIAPGAWKKLPLQPSWQVRVRGLRTGPNRVSIRARDETGNRATQTAVITRLPPP